MAVCRHWVTRVGLILAVGLTFGIRAAASPAAALQPPGPLTDGDYQMPTEPQYPVLPVDYLSPVSQEGFADSAAGPASGGGSTAAGTLPASDNFSDPSAGLLPRASSRPDSWKIGYVGGEYQIASVGSVLDASESVLANGSYSDVSIAVDTHLVQGTATNPDQTVRLYCRRQTSGAGFTGYRFQYSPLLNAFAVMRGDGSSGVSLTDVQYISGPPFAAQTHHLVLTCAGDSISASVDGRQVASVRDASYRDGSAALGVGNFTRVDLAGILGAGAAYPGTYDARFGALVLSKPG